MPIPKPTENETEREFINRCMGDDAMNSEYTDEDIRAGVCYTQWREKGKSMDKIERKTFRGMELKADKPGTFTARIATLNVPDHDGDVTVPGAFPQGKEILISAYQHRSWDGALTVGKGVIREAGNEVFIDGEFNLKTETGREHYETVKFAPHLQEWSYGFKATEVEPDVDWEGVNVARILRKLEPFEASPVLRGAGINTGTLVVKAMTFSDEADTVLAAVKAFVARTKSLADLRQEEGRNISEANVKRLQTLVDELQSEVKEAQSILEAAEPAEKGKAALLKLRQFKFEMEAIR
jgi:hypothetical protein